MTREVEERIVAMRFDNQDFEKNAKTTIDTLGQLKDGLNFQGSAKGLNVFEKAAKALKIDKVKDNLRTIKSNLTGMNGALDKAFTITSAPVQAMEGFMSTVRGMIGKVIGFDIANMLVNGLTNAFREVTVQPITAGFNEYELKMDSIKTIMSGSGESLQSVKQTLEQLNLYADKTIYSFSDMTSNIGKFTNNGVALKDATMAMKGIANATADAGQGAQQASMAMYNISQAIGVGTMKSIDWKSLENANIATLRLKNTLIQTAAANGKLVTEVVEENEKKVTKYYALTEKEAKKGLKGLSKEAKKAAQVTAENFRDTLQRDWLDKDSMLNAFAIYSGDIQDLDTIMAMGFTEEQARELLKIGEDAMKAATEVRTFTKMWDALKESAQSGWASSIELILGDMNEATNLWTNLNNIFDSIISEGADKREKALLEWRGLERAEDGSLKRVSKLDGREDLIKGITYTIENIRKIFSTIGEAWENVFGRIDGTVLAKLTQGFKKLAWHISYWWITGEKGNKRIDKLRRGLSGLFSILKVVINFVKSGLKLVSKAVQPVANVLLTLFDKVFGFFSGIGDLRPMEVINRIGDGFTKLWNKTKNFFTKSDLGNGNKGDSPFVSMIKNNWESFKTVLKQWAADTGFDEVGTWLQEKWTQLWQLPGFSDVADVFNTAMDEITKLFTRSITMHDENGHELKQKASPFEYFFISTFKSIEKTIQDIFGWEIWGKIGTFFGNIWNDLVSLFTPQTLHDANGHELKQKGDSPFVAYFKTVWNDLNTFFEEVKGWPIWNTISEFFTGIWDSISELFKPSITMHDDNGQELKQKQSPIVYYINQAFSEIKSVWNTVSGWEGWEKIKTFFTGIWDSILGFFNGDSSEGGESENSGSGHKSVKKRATVAQRARAKLKEIMEVTEDIQNKSTGKNLKTTALELLTNFLDKVGKFFSNLAAIAMENSVVSGVMNLLNGMITFFNGMSTFIGNVLTAIGHIAGGTGSKEEWIGFVLGILTAIGAFVGKLRLMKYMSGIEMQSIGLQFLEIAAGVFILGEAVSQLGKMNLGQLLQGGIAVGVLAIAVGFLMAGLNGIMTAVNEGKKDDPVKWYERVLNGLIKWGGIAAILKIFMDELPVIIKVLGENNLKGEDVYQTLKGLTIAIGGITMIVGLISLLGKGIDIGSTAKTTAAIVIGFAILSAGIAGILAAIAGAAAGLGGGTQNTVKQIAEFGEILSAIGSSINGFFRSLFGIQTQEQKMESAFNLIEKLSESGKDFSNERVANIIDVLATFATLGQRLPQDFSLIGWQAFVDGMPFVITGMETVKQAFGDFADSEYLAGLKSWSESVGILAEALGRKLDAGNFINNITDLAAALSDNEGYFKEDLNTVTKFLGQAAIDGIGTEGLTFDATPIVDAIAVAIGEGSPKIGAAVHRMVQAGINFMNEDLGSLTVTDPNSNNLFGQLSGLLTGNFDVSSYLSFGKDENGNDITMQGYVQKMLGGLNLDSLVSTISTQFGGLGTTLETKVPNLLEIFSVKGYISQDGESGENSTINSIIGDIQGSASQIQDALSGLDGLTVKVAPVLDLTNWETEKARLDTIPFNMMNRFSLPQINLPNENKTPDYSRTMVSKLEELIGKITTETDRTVRATNTVNTSVGKLNTSISGMKVVMDTGALVGAIVPSMDSALFKRMLVFGRIG